MDNSMIVQNVKIITAHLNENEAEKITALKELLSLPDDEAFDKSTFNFSNAGLKYKPCNRLDVKISIDELIENSYTVFSQFYDDISLEKFYELKSELLKLPIEKYPVVLFFENKYIDLAIYHIFHFIKNTKYIITHIEDEKRHFYSKYQTNVLEIYIKDLERIKTTKFLYPASEFDQEILEKKEKLLSFAKENYSMLFAWNAMTASQNMKGAFIDQSIDKAMEIFTDSLNAIRTTKKDAIKSLAVLLFKLHDAHMNDIDIELSVENILRIFFKNEIEELNKNKKLSSDYLDTFKITSKEYKKNAYISSVFDGIPIYGINDENKYFYFYKMTVKEIMKMYFSSIQKASPSIEKIQLPQKKYYKYIRQQFQTPHIMSYQPMYLEFYSKKNPTILDMMATNLHEMKKSAPDYLKNS
jgi:hypothetical protein